MSTVLKYYTNLQEVAMSELKKIVQEVLMSNADLKDFKMGMGVYFFTDNRGETVNVEERKMNANYNYYYAVSRPSFQVLYDFMAEWDDTLGMTGNEITINKPKQ